MIQLIYKLLLLSLFFTLETFANAPLDLSKDTTQKEFLKHLYCIDAPNNDLDFEDILKNNNLTQSSKSNLGYKYNDYWCKMSIVNSSNNIVQRVFSNPRAGMDYLKVKIYKNNSIEQFNLGDMHTPKNRSYHSSFSNFELSLKPKELVTIVFKYNSVGPVEIRWDLYDFKSFMKNENKNNLFVYFFLGFILAMFIYKSFIYFHLKDKEYLIYALMMLTIFIPQFAVHGTMHLYLFEYIDTFFITLVNWVFVHMFLTFMWIFTYYFFDISKKSRFYYPLVSVIVYNFIITLLYASSYIFIDILQITPIVSQIAFLESVFLLLFTGVMVYQKKPGALFFFGAHLMYIFSIFAYIMLLNGKINLNIISTHSVEIGLLSMILMMSLALSRKFQKIKKENQKQKELIEKNKQYTMIGTTISYVTHQWKQPLSILGVKTNNLLLQSEFEPDIPIKDIKPKLLDVENQVMFISDTLDSIKELFRSSSNDEVVFSLDKVFDTLEVNFLDTLKKNNIKLSIKKTDDITLYGDQNLLIHTFSNMIQNAIEHFKKEQKDKQITIKTYMTKEFYAIDIIDNAGGIDTDILDKLFESHITTKTFGTGIGLPFSKAIIGSKFQGKITASNKDDGAIFTITIPKGKK